MRNQVRSAGEASQMIGHVRCAVKQALWIEARELGWESEEPEPEQGENKEPSGLEGPVASQCPMPVPGCPGPHGPAPSASCWEKE